jgi:hypothetical protein
VIVLLESIPRFLCLVFLFEDWPIAGIEHGVMIVQI